jgi:ring-1,2-phenylacetyl-CoA epoxidase subunit PaaC
MDGAVREVLLAFADDELLMGHRHSEWLGVAPFLEEDLAHASIAQDELGHARALYRLMGDDPDLLGFERDAASFRSSWLVELPCDRWEDALARHFFYDLAEQVRWRDLASSSIAGASELAAKALREEAYHVDHAVPLVRKLLDGTPRSHELVRDALTRLYPVARSLFEPTSGSEAAAAHGLAPPGDLEREWIEDVGRLLDEAGVAFDPGAGPSGLGGRKGLRSEHFADLFATMTSVYSLEPGAAW